MEKEIIHLEDCVTKDMTLDDANRMLQENPFFMKSTFKTWDELTNNPDTNWWYFQYDLLELIPFGRMRLKSMKEKLLEQDQELSEALESIYKKLKTRIDRAVAGALDSQKDFDMIINYPDLEMNETYVNVPKTVRKGLFKKETIYEKEKRETFSYVEKQIIFNGWRLAHFERTYRAIEQSYRQKLNWDFVLGKDGVIYHITSGYLTKHGHPTDNGKFFYIVREAIFFDTCSLKSINQAYFIAVSHGALLTLGSILRELKTTSGEYQTSYIDSSGNEEYYINFPPSPSLNADFDLQTLYSILASFYVHQ